MASFSSMDWTPEKRRWALLRTRELRFCLVMGVMAALIRVRINDCPDEVGVG